MSAAVAGVKATFCSAGMPSPATVFFTRAMGRKRLLVSSPAPVAHLYMVASMCCAFTVAWEILAVSSCVLCACSVHNAVLHFAVSWIPCHSACPLGSPPISLSSCLWCFLQFIHFDVNV
jgi:hypothetical protein